MNPREELRQAIATHVFVRATPDRPIIGGNERDPAEWLFDFRALLLQPKWLDRYAELFWETYADRYPFQVCGMETAAISLVAAIVMKGVARGTPVGGIYIRKSRKRQGLLKQIEGTPDGTPVILVDDLINSGSTFDKQLKILTEAQAHVSDIFVLLAFRELNTYSFALAPDMRITNIFTLRDFDLPMREKEPQNDLAAFETVWKFSAPHPLRNIVGAKSAPMIDATRVYFGTDAGVFYALDQKDGNVRWTFTVDRGGADNAIFSHPALYKGSVYFGAGDGKLYCIDAATGVKRWEYSGGILGADSMSSSPVVATRPGCIFVGLEFGLIRRHGGLAAISLKTGKKIWSATVSGAVVGAPLYIERENLVVIGTLDGIVHAYAADTGILRWRYGTQGPTHESFAYDETRRMIFFGSMDGKLYALLARDGSPIFATEARAGIRSTPLIVGDSVYFSSLDKHLYAVTIDTGELRWRFATKGRIFSSPVMIEKSVWIGSNDGKLYEISPEHGALKRFFQASERVIDAPAYNQKTERLFVLTQANELYCIKRT